MLMRLSYEDAERAKKGESIEGVDSFTSDSVIENVSVEIVNEITRSFGYFKTASGNEKIDKIMLSGGSSRIRNLDNFLQSHLDIPVEVINPFRKIEIPPEFDSDYLRDMAPIAAVVVGLGIRRLNDK